MPIKIWSVVFSIIFIFQSITYGQTLCSGSLGDNIFLDGDFGSGVEPTLSIDPKIAPNYQYTKNVPNDGSYTITKNTSNLNGLYPSWLRIDDNSGTSNGYFMVVNASFAPGIFYEKVIEGLCGNTTYEFSADIVNLISSNTVAPPHIDPNVNFLLDDVVFYSTGTIAKTNLWKTYGFTFTTAPGKTSIKLTLRNNAPGGIGNDLGLDNIKFRPCGPASFIGITSDKTKFLCIDGSPFAVKAKVDNNLKNYYIWQLSNDNITWKEIAKGEVDSVVHNTFIPGKYYYRYYSAGDIISIENSKCRVLSDVVSIEVLPQIYVKYDTICFGNSFSLGNEKITESGYYEGTFISSKNCDSTLQLFLTVLPDPNINIPSKIIDPSCFGYSNGSIIIENISGGSPPYRIFYNNQLQTSEIKNLGRGNYTVVVKDRYQCQDSTYLILDNPTKLILSEISDTSITLGDELDLELIANLPLNKVSWNPPNLFSCPSCNITSSKIGSTQTIKVKAITDANCVDSLSFKVIVSKDKIYFLPNIIKANSGLNENFILYSYKAAVQSIESFDLFDRLGNLMVEKSNITFMDNPTILWDGKLNNKFVSPGVYTYILKLKLLDNSILIHKGNLTFIN